MKDLSMICVDYNGVDFERNEIRRMNKIQRRKREVQAQKRLLKKFAVTICVIMGLALTFGSVHSYATQTEEINTNKYYKSICVSYGDTLNSFADEYMSIEFKTRDKFINEIKEINHLKDDTIYAGTYLIVPYYE